MTNKEIMQASLLDIIFEHRNKDYGAYALRKTYDIRLLTALGAGLSVVSILIFFGMMNSGKQKAVATYTTKDSVLIKEYKMPVAKPKLPEKPKEVVKQKPVAKKTAQVKLTSTIDIKKDELVKTTVTPVENLADKKPGDEDVKGVPDDGTVKLPELPATGAGTGNEVVPETTKFSIQERSAEFPGGADALHKFLAKNLKTPEDLEAGEKKVVKIRFKVDKDGAVNSFEIVTSGGEEFDEEVLRVCKKMPRWTPAFQNGINVPVNYMIPVTFLGVEY